MHQTHSEKNSLCQRQYCIKSIYCKQNWWWTQSLWHWNQEFEWWKFVQALQGTAHNCTTMTSKLEEECWTLSHYLDLYVRYDLFVIHLPLWFICMMVTRRKLLYPFTLPPEAEFNMTITPSQRFTSRERRRFASPRECNSTTHARRKDTSKICILRTSW